MLEEEEEDLRKCADNQQSGYQLTPDLSELSSAPSVFGTYSPEPKETLEEIVRIAAASADPVLAASPAAVPAADTLPHIHVCVMLVKSSEQEN